LLIQEDHNWLSFQKPHVYTSEINTTHLRNGPVGLGCIDRLGNANRT
jgi:XapX domain-containing protein